MQICWHYKVLLFVLATILCLSGCQPDELEVELFASDVLEAATGKLVLIPFTAVFSMIGADENQDLEKAGEIASRFFENKLEYEVSRIESKAKIIVRGKIPLGDTQSLSTYLEEHRYPCALLLDSTRTTVKTIKLISTSSLSDLNNKLNGVNFVLGCKLPASVTRFRILNDGERRVKVRAIAVFVNGKPFLLLERDLSRRGSLTLEFKGGDESVYCEVEPQVMLSW